MSGGSRILYIGVHDRAYPRNRRIRAFLSDRGHAVTTVDKPAKGLIGRLIGTAAALARAGRRHDVVVVSEFGTTLVPLAWAAARLRGQRLVVDGFVSLVETHIDDWSTYRAASVRGLLLRFADTLAVRLADLYLVDTDVRGRAIRAQRTPVITLPVGAPAWATPLPPAHGSARRLRVLYYGNYIPLHGLDTVIDAVAMAAQTTSLHLTLIGDGAGRPAAERHARSLGAPCTFLPPVPEAALHESMRDHDVVLGVFGTSQKAGGVIANKVWQALASGRRVITRSSAALDEIRPIVGDQLIETTAGDAASLAAALVSMRGAEAPPAAANDALERYVGRRFARLADWLDGLGTPA